MKKTFVRVDMLFAIGVPMLLFGIAILFLKSSFFEAQSNSLVQAIALDLVITIPFIHFLIIRKSTITNLSVIPVMIIGLVIGSNFLPEGQQGLLTLFKSYALPIVEVCILSLAGWKIYRAITTFQSYKTVGEDFYTVAKKTCEEMVPRILAIPLATEISMIYYGFIKWKAKPLEHNEFSYHRRSGTQALLAGLMFIIAAEAFAMHFVVGLWSNIAAWILTGLSSYTILQFYGFLKSLAQRPIVVNDDGITLRYGIMAEAFIQSEQISSVERSRKSLKDLEGFGKLSPLGDIDVHNLIIHLHQECEVQSIYGIKRNIRYLALHVDDVEGFIAAVEKG